MNDPIVDEVRRIKDELAALSPRMKMACVIYDQPAMDVAVDQGDLIDGSLRR
jgi:hypothetical protein